ncbi:MAG: hypothetical protein Q4B68_08175 [Bacteroidales bacterium]|nr:hypothetical protein [Bacteroidales bacterium]
MICILVFCISMAILHCYSRSKVAPVAPQPDHRIEFYPESDGFAQQDTTLKVNRGETIYIYASIHPSTGKTARFEYDPECFEGSTRTVLDNPKAANSVECGGDRGKSVQALRAIKCGTHQVTCIQRFQGTVTAQRTYTIVVK